MQPQQPQQDDWSAHIASWQSGKLSRIAYCQQHHLKYATFVYQIRALQRKVVTQAVTLVPVKVPTVPVKAPTVSTAPPKRDLVLRAPNGWSLVLGADVSALWLGELMGRLT